MHPGNVPMLAKLDRSSYIGTYPVYHLQSRSPHQVHRERTKRTKRNKRTTAGIKANSTNGLLWLLLLQVVGGQGAIRKDAVWLRVGMVVELLGESGKLLLTNDGSKKASFL